MKCYRQFIYLLVFVLLLTTSCSESNNIKTRDVKFDPIEPGVVRFMTYNIRYGTADDGQNSWQYRKNLVFDTIADHRADIIGLQEALDFQISEIKRALGQYSVVWVGRDDGQQAGEACPTGTIWFGSPLPQLLTPRTRSVPASPTADRLRQKVLEMPR